MEEARPTWLAYKARDGIFETFFKHEGGEEAFNAFVRRAIVWSERSAGHYCLLDTFLSDTIDSSNLSMLIQRASSDSPVHVLLADPECHFAATRAAAIGELPAARRATLGLRKLVRAVCSALGVGNVDADALEYEAALGRLKELAPKAFLEIKFYDVLPSGPMFFFKDILLCGRYCTGVSSRDLPWFMIVDDPHRENDMFDIFWREFALVWNDEDQSSGALGEIKPVGLAHPSQKIGHRYFLSYSWENRQAADHIETLLHRQNRQILRDEKGVKAGRGLSGSIRRLIDSADTFLALYSKEYGASSWCQGELEYALDRRDAHRIKRVILVRLDDSSFDSIRVAGDLWVSGQDREKRITSVGRVLAEE